MGAGDEHRADNDRLASAGLQWKGCVLLGMSGSHVEALMHIGASATRRVRM